MQKCPCGSKTNVAYIFQGRGGEGKWKSVGRYCARCGRFWNEKKVRLHEGVRVEGVVR